MAGLPGEDRLEHDGTRMEPQVTQACDPLFYKYENLPTPTSIRLLKILPSPNDQVSCELITVDLEDAVQFDALSYTWGDPVTIYERLDEELRAWVLAHDKLTKDDILKFVQKSGISEPIDHEKKYLVDNDALDYRISYPSILYEQVNNYTDKTRFIYCKGNKIQVTDNLFDVLSLFRRFVMQDIGMSINDFPALFTRPLSTYIWIDAICINQEDKEERNSQVMLMGKIYSMSQNVFCWVGKADVFSGLGIKTLFELSKRLLKDPTMQDRWYGSLYDVQGINDRDWLALFSILQRTWFRRAWVIQELVFASRVTMLCGSGIFRWTIIEIVLQFMLKTRLDDKLSEMVQNLMRRGSSKKELRLMRKAATSKEAYGKNDSISTSSKHILSVNPKAVYTLAAGVRTMKHRLGIEFEYICRAPQEKTPNSSKAIQKPNEDESVSSQTTERLNKNSIINSDVVSSDKPYPFSPKNLYPKIVSTHYDRSSEIGLFHIDPGPQPSIPLLSILATFRICGASDPRDKIFAFLNLAAKGQTGSLHDSYPLEVDYASSVQSVYITATRFMLETSGLTILSHIQDPSLTKINDLPSWVPDFSVDIGRFIIELEVSSPWKASGEKQNAAFKIDDENCLILEGVMIDTISGVIGLGGCYFERVSKLVLSTPKWYLNNHGLPPTFVSHRPDVFDHKRSPLFIPSPEDTDFPCISRVEALWRTLTGDSLHNSFPAPASCGFGFSDWVSLHLERAHKLYSSTLIFKTRSVAETEYIKRWMATKLSLWEALNADEVGGFYTLEEIRAAKQKGMGTLDCQSDATAERANNTELDGHGLRYLPDDRRLNQVVKREVCYQNGGMLAIQTDRLTIDEKAQLSAFETRMREMKRGRRLFRTGKGYLGMGPVSVELGDQVWVLKGVNVPFVLRKVGDGRFKVVGEAYVHGIMGGEALRGGPKFREVVLE